MTDHEPSYQRFFSINPENKFVDEGLSTPVDQTLAPFLENKDPDVLQRLMDFIEVTRSAATRKHRLQLSWSWKGAAIGALLFAAISATGISFENRIKPDTQLQEAQLAKDNPLAYSYYARLKEITDNANTQGQQLSFGILTTTGFILGGAYKILRDRG